MLPERIKAITDGSTTAANQTGGWRASSNKNIKFDSSEERFDSDFYGKMKSQINLDENMKCEKWKRHDEGLDIISEGLDILKNIAFDVDEEIDR